MVFALSFWSHARRLQLSFDERSCDHSVDMPLVPDAAALHRCTERQEGNVMDHAITWKEGTRDAAGNVAKMLIPQNTSARNYACTPCQAETRNLG